jgi:hypothetical protein
MFLPEVFSRQIDGSALLPNSGRLARPGRLVAADRREPLPARMGLTRRKESLTLGGGHGVSAGIGLCPILLWSGLVVSSP